jgi:hypothetical protein
LLDTNIVEFMPNGSKLTINPLILAH